MQQQQQSLCRAVWRLPQCFAKQEFMHSMHFWAQMVEQTLVIILFIEQGDVHIYVPPPPKKKKRRRGKGRRESCDDVMSGFFLMGESLKELREIIL